MIIGVEKNRTVRQEWRLTGANSDAGTISLKAIHPKRPKTSFCCSVHWKKFWANGDLPSKHRRSDILGWNVGLMTVQRILGDLIGQFFKCRPSSPNIC